MALSWCSSFSLALTDADSWQIMKQTFLDDMSMLANSSATRNTFREEPCCITLQMQVSVPKNTATYVYNLFFVRFVRHGLSSV